MLYIFGSQSYIMHAHAHMRVYACFSLSEQRQQTTTDFKIVSLYFVSTEFQNEGERTKDTTATTNMFDFIILNVLYFDKSKPKFMLYIKTLNTGVLCSSSLVFLYLTAIWSRFQSTPVESAIFQCSPVSDGFLFSPQQNKSPAYSRLPWKPLDCWVCII
jgi:hypothetical protein